MCVAACRRMFPASQWSAEINAAIASAGFFWLVGESELRSEPVEVRPSDGHPQLQQQYSMLTHIRQEHTVRALVLSASQWAAGMC